MSAKTILVIEDEYFLADDCASLAKKEGYKVAGPFGTLEEASLGLEAVDGAIVDINLQGTFVYPLLDRLIERNIPIVLYTGYDGHVVPERYSHLPAVRKPQGCRDALLLLRQLIGQPTG